MSGPNSAGAGYDAPPVAVIGAGTIGLGWTALLLAHGYRVRVYVRRPDASARVSRAVELSGPSLPGGSATVPELLQRLEVTASLPVAVDGAGVVLESAPERLELKQELFEAVERWAPADALLLSSTSTLLPAAIGAQLTEPGRVIVAHPFNPPYVIPLVEVLGSEDTDHALLTRVAEFLTGIGRTPVVLRQPVAGLIANRLQTALLRECIHLVQQGVGTVADVDAVVTGSIGLRWATIGPFRALHLGGGEGGLRQWFAHIGAGLAAGWGQLGAPTLDQATIDALIDQAEENFADRSYEQQVTDRDARQLTVLQALHTAVPEGIR